MQDFVFSLLFYFFPFQPQFSADSFCGRSRKKPASKLDWNVTKRRNSSKCSSATRSGSNDPHLDASWMLQRGAPSRESSVRRNWTARWRCCDWGVGSLEEGVTVQQFEANVATTSQCGGAETFMTSRCSVARVLGLWRHIAVLQACFRFGIEASMSWTVVLHV